MSSGFSIGAICLLVGLLCWSSPLRGEEIEEGPPPAFAAVEVAIDPVLSRAERLPVAPVAPLKKEEREVHIASKRVLLCAGVATASGLLAWWSKEKADRAYARYMHSASIARQEKFFDRAERYDRIAGGAFLGMEAGVVLTTVAVFF